MGQYSLLFVCLLAIYQADLHTKMKVNHFVPLAWFSSQHGVRQYSLYSGLSDLKLSKGLPLSIQTSRKLYGHNQPRPFPLTQLSGLQAAVHILTTRWQKCAIHIANSYKDGSTKRKKKYDSSLNKLMKIILILSRVEILYVKEYHKIIYMKISGQF